MDNVVRLWLNCDLTKVHIRNLIPKMAVLEE